MANLTKIVPAYPRCGVPDAILRNHSGHKHDGGGPDFGTQSLFMSADGSHLKSKRYGRFAFACKACCELLGFKQIVIMPWPQADPYECLEALNPNKENNHGSTI